MQSEWVSRDKVWRMLSPDDSVLSQFELALPAPPIICRILANRGIVTLDDARQFLLPDLDELHDPFLLDGMFAAVERTRLALERKEKIMVHGDYDADGLTSAALLVRVLRILEADVSWYVPHRRRDGYGVSIAGVESAKEQGVSLIITVDCGSTAVEAVERARELGVDVVVTDHHEVGDSPAKPLALVNPKKPGCPYPFKELAGAGVAFKFAEALVGECGYDVSVYRRRFCDLAAIGTVADAVPILGENRVLVKFGMEELPRTGKAGLKALLETAGLTGKTLTSRMLAFGLAPRLNAAGRLDDASVALELLLTLDQTRAAELAGMLDAQNRERQIEQERITAEAFDQIADRGLDRSTKVLVLYSQGWHPGVIGIVASKICERHCRPSILFALDETGTEGVGSARSVEAFDIYRALSRCSDLLGRFGGHAGAAGLSISSDRIPEFEAEINRVADSVLSEEDLVSSLVIDAELDLASVNCDLASELQVLAPHGAGNPEPVFTSRNAVVTHRTVMGSGGAHLRLRLQSADESVECVAFGWGDRDDIAVGSVIDLCYNVRINDFNGSQTAQAVLRDARPSCQ